MKTHNETQFFPRNLLLFKNIQIITAKHRTGTSQYRKWATRLEVFTVEDRIKTEKPGTDPNFGV
jgi:hypothetical protein